MNKQALRVLKTVGVLKSWTGADAESREVLQRLRMRGYVYQVVKRQRASEVAGRPPSYRLTETGRAAVVQARIARKSQAKTSLMR